MEKTRNERKKSSENLTERRSLNISTSNNVQIQIVVSQVVFEEADEDKHNRTPTDISITAMTRGSSNKRKNKLPPLVLPESRGRAREESPSRIPVPRSATRSFSLSPSSHTSLRQEHSSTQKGTTSDYGNQTRTRSNDRYSSSNTNTTGSTCSTVKAAGSSLQSNSLPTLLYRPQRPRSRYHQDCLVSPNTHSSSFLSLPMTVHHSRRKSSTGSSNLLSPSSFSPTYSHSYSCSSTTGSNLPSPSSTYSSYLDSRKGSTSSADERVLESGQVEHYLKNNPDFVSSYVQRNVDMDTLQQWMVDRHKVVSQRKLSLSKWKFGNGSEKCSILKHLAVQLRRNPPEGNVLWELALCISSAVGASSFVLYLLDDETQTLRRFSPLKNVMEFESYSVEDHKETLATHVAKRREPARMSRKEAETRFARGVGDNKANLEESCYILCHPIIKADSELSGVIELHRQDPKTPFYMEDEEIVNSYLVWGGIALHYADLNSTMHKHKKLNDFLLGVVRSIFQDMVSMDTVIKKVMNFAQKLVDADRASLFLLDSKTKELYARLFDMGGQDLKSASDLSLEGPGKEIRFPIGTGIAGQVAATGGVLNIPDAYKDDRFNRNVDNITGYVTKSILCMPVFIRGTVIGVVQMVNKKHGSFTKEDEEAFETFAVYCGLALHHAKLYDKIRRSEQKYKVALEVLSYHNTCTEEEFEKARSVSIPSKVAGIDDFLYKAMSVDNMEKVHESVFMFVDLFGLNRFDLDSLYRFVLTVKKNYRLVPYHNWSHGFTVANCMYSILKASNVYRPLECLALFIGSLCHDLDHRGRNNKFMLETASPLASIYSTSTLEHHHFNQTVTILQQDGHNIFGKLSSEEYKQVLGNIKHCILATDLALFFANKVKLQQLLDKDAFTWNVPEHRLLAQAISMTASDLCASAKPWDVQSETVQVIFQEFYEQGDLERRAGRIPIPMMDRTKIDEQPASQVGFISGICIPCYDLLYKLIPETLPLLDGCKVNLARWQALLDEKERSKTA